MEEINTTGSLPDFKSLFDYDKDNGRLIWKIHSGRAFIGKEAGTAASGGYRRVLICKVSYAVHHIVWWFETGAWPTEIDHIDMDPQNNHISNLREVTRSENMLNKRLQSNNSSGVKGVHFCRSRGRWKCQLRKYGRPSVQKYFDNYEEAVEFRRKMENEFYGQTYRKD